MSPTSETIPSFVFVRDFCCTQREREREGIAFERVQVAIQESRNGNVECRSGGGRTMEMKRTRAIFYLILFMSRVSNGIQFSPEKSAKRCVSVRQQRLIHHPR